MTLCPNRARHRDARVRAESTLHKQMVRASLSRLLFALRAAPGCAAVWLMQS